MDEQLMRTSLHEAGHLVVAKSLGRQGTLHLWRESLRSPWSGRVRFNDAEEQWSAYERILVALAGSVAEVLLGAEDPMTSEAVFLEADYQRRLGGTLFLSEPDLALARGFERGHVDRAFTIVTGHSGAILAAAADARTFSLACPGACGLAPP